MTVVADASAVGRFLLPDEAGAEADYAWDMCRSKPLHAPPHWRVEVANLLRKAYRRGRIDTMQLGTAALQADLLVRAVTIEREASVGDLLRTANQKNLSAYDASYLLLAQRLGVSLLAFDGPLRRAALVEGVTVLP